MVSRALPSAAQRSVRGAFARLVEELLLSQAASSNWRAARLLGRDAAPRVGMLAAYFTPHTELLSDDAVALYSCRNARSCDLPRGQRWFMLPKNITALKTSC